jgi:DNA (cytosine-5)-methyltransferase 1
VGVTAYYNEIDPYAAQWLRNLIAAGHIAKGVVDERSIVDVHPADLAGFTQCHFFAGIGGWSHALRLAGIPDDRPVWTGSCPCQPFSAAGKQRGSDDERHLWPAFFGLIRERRPATVLGEQVAGAAGLAWLDHVCADLEGEGYAAAAADLPACSVGADHKRARLFWVANSQRDEQPRQEPRSREAGRMGGQFQPVPWDEPWPVALARFRAVGDGLPRCVAATDAARNAIVPQVAAAFIEAVMETA